MISNLIRRVSMASLVGAAMCFDSAPAAIWYDSEAAAGDPIVTLSRVSLGYEFTRETSSREKFIPAVNWAFGPKTGRHDWSLGIEMPVWVNNPKWGSSESGLGDFKVRVVHNWVDNDSWLVASYFETEFDTADDDVQAIANQRTQMALGGGFIRNFGSGWACGAALQYGWSTDAGTTNGHKSEWEYRVGLRKKLLEPLTRAVVYKGTIIMIGDTNHNATIEPSLSWRLDQDGKWILWLACEIPLEGKSEDFTAKGSLSWLF